MELQQRRRTGQVLVILALALAALVGVAAVSIDAFYLYWNRDRLQGATDAAALAGVTYLSDVTLTDSNSSCAYSATPQNAACIYALANGILQSEITDISIDSAAMSVRVSASRTVPALFARVLGIHNFTVSATSMAVARPIGSARGVVPIGLDAETPYSYGQPIVMHVGGCGPGCWQGLALQSNSSGASGANAFRENLAAGCDCTVKLGDMLTSEPGATVGPTSQGIAQRLASGQTSDPSGTWSSHTTDDARAVTVPLVDWSGCAGRCTARVTGFAEVWISGSSGSDINAVFIRQVASGEPGPGGTPDTGAVHATLIQ